MPAELVRKQRNEPPKNANERNVRSVRKKRRHAGGRKTRWQASKAKSKT